MCVLGSIDFDIGSKGTELPGTKAMINQENCIFSGSVLIKLPCNYMSLAEVLATGILTYNSESLLNFQNCLLV